MRLTQNLDRLERNLNQTTNDYNKVRLKKRDVHASGIKLLMPYDHDYVEANGDTEDKLNFTAVNRGYAGLQTDLNKKRKPKSGLRRNVPIDVYHEV